MATPIELIGLIALRWAHFFSVFFWVGGVFFLFLVAMPMLPRVRLPSGMEVMSKVVSRFHTMLWFDYAAVAATGLALAYVTGRIQGLFTLNNVSIVFIAALIVVGFDILVVDLSVIFRVDDEMFRIARRFRNMTHTEMFREQIKLGKLDRKLRRQVRVLDLGLTFTAMGLMAAMHFGF